MNSSAKLLRLSSALLLIAAAIFAFLSAVAIARARHHGAGFFATYVNVLPASALVLASTLMGIASNKKRNTSNEGR